MIKTSFKIPFYNVSVTLVQVEGKEDAEPVAELLRKNKIRDDDNYTYNGILRDATNGGDTCRDLEHKRILVLFYRMENERLRDEIYSHEKRHIEDRILEFFGVNDIESAGLLAGYLGGKFYDFKQLQNK